MTINSRVMLRLLAMPIGLMGLVQMTFALLSFVLFHDQMTVQFLLPGAAMTSCAALVLLTSIKIDLTKIGFRDALLFTTLTWVVMGLLGAAPIALITGVSLTDAIFESISGITTTGATILSGLDDMPKSFLLYRQFLQWLGGLAVVIFVVAVLPMLNVGGMRLLRAETPGPVKDDKLSPRIASTAHYLWLVYLTITVACVIAYLTAGMGLYDAIAHSFTTVSTGGFSPYDSNMGHFGSPIILLVANVFMLLGAISFTLHFRIMRARNPSLYWRDEETRWFLIIIAVLSILITGILLQSKTYDDPLIALNNAVFHLISFITSTGYGAADFTAWPGAIVLLLIFAAYLGGCAGSTAGGNKIVRNILTVKLVLLEMKRLVSPRGVFMVKYQGQLVDADVLSATVAFMTIAAFSTSILTLALMATDLDFLSALTAVAACLNVVGPAFGELGNNFQPVSDTGTWILSGAMILGRLEYFTVLALFSMAFWRQ